MWQMQLTCRPVSRLRAHMEKSTVCGNGRAPYACAFHPLANAAPLRAVFYEVLSDGLPGCKNALCLCPASLQKGC